MPVDTVFIVGIVVLSTFIIMYCWWWLVNLGLTQPITPWCLREQDTSRGSNYRLLVSAQCSPYQDWQAVGVWWSAKQNWPSVRYTRLLSCGMIKRQLYKYHHAVPSYLASDWSTHPDTGDSYAPYNRPVSIKEYLDDITQQEEYMVIIDPDTIIRKPLDDVPVGEGTPVAQRYDYLNDKGALQKLGQKFIGTKDNLQPLGMPMIIHRDDLKRLVPEWLELTEKIRNDPEAKKLAGWIAEMHSYCLAAAKLGLKHTIRNDLADRTPYKRIDDPYILHYDLRHECKDFSWDKRDYISTDLLAGKKLIPVPRQPPNDRFLEVFEMLNKALVESRKHIKKI